MAKVDDARVDVEAISQNQKSLDINRQKKQLSRLSILLDDAFVIPVLGVRIGWDSILGLVPGVGDAAGAVISSYFVYKGFRFKMPAKSLGIMVMNIVVELVIGMVPVLGDVFDIIWKSNRRNFHIIEKYLDQQEKCFMEEKKL